MAGSVMTQDLNQLLSRAKFRVYVNRVSRDQVMVESKDARILDDIRLLRQGQTLSPKSPLLKIQTLLGAWHKLLLQQQQQQQQRQGQEEEKEEEEEGGCETPVALLDLSLALALYPAWLMPEGLPHRVWNVSRQACDRLDALSQLAGGAALLARSKLFTGRAPPQP